MPIAGDTIHGARLVDAAINAKAPQKKHKTQKHTTIFSATPNPKAPPSQVSIESTMMLVHW